LSLSLGDLLFVSAQNQGASVLVSGVSKQMTEVRKQKTDLVLYFSSHIFLSSDLCHLTSVF